jgi:outer membrane immunogenic protein
MRWSVFAGAGLLSVLAASGSVFAAEIPIQARPKAAPARAPARPVVQQAAAQPTSNWSGSQVGGFNGVSNMSNAMVEPGAFLYFPGISSANVETPFSVKRHPWSYTAGVFLGHNWQLGSYVVGAEGDIAWKNASSHNTLNTFVCSGANCRVESFNGTVSQNWDSSIRARGGFLYTPSTLIYATGGVAFGEVKGSFGYAATINPAFSATSGERSWSDTRVGWTVGAGVEQVVATGWKARVEYRYTDFGEYSKTIPLGFSCVGAGCGALVSGGARVDLHPTFHTFRVGLGYDF